MLLRTPFNLRDHEDIIVFLVDTSRDRYIGYFYINEQTRAKGLVCVEPEGITYFDAYYMYNKINVIIK